jgi:hypothetical protein
MIRVMRHFEPIVRRTLWRDATEFGSPWARILPARTCGPRDSVAQAWPA